MRKLTEHLTNEETRDLYVNESAVESVMPISGTDVAVSAVRMTHGTVYHIRGEAADVAATLKSAQDHAVQMISEELLPALTSLSPTIIGAVTQMAEAVAEAPPA